MRILIPLFILLCAAGCGESVKTPAPVEVTEGISTPEGAVREYYDLYSDYFKQLYSWANKSYRDTETHENDFSLFQKGRYQFFITEPLKKRFDSLYKDPADYYFVLSTLGWSNKFILEKSPDSNEPFNAWGVIMSQQYDTFLIGTNNSKIQFITKGKTNGNTEIWDAYISTTHIIYGQYNKVETFNRRFLPDHDKSVIPFEDLKKIFDQIDYRQKQGENFGKGYITAVDTNETHTFYLDTQNGGYKIKNIEFKVTGYSLDRNNDLFDPQ